MLSILARVRSFLDVAMAERVRAPIANRAEHTALEALVAAGNLSRDSAERSAQLVVETGEPLDQVLAKLGLMTEREFASAVAEQFSLPLDLELHGATDGGLLAEANPEYLQRKRVFPLVVENERLKAAVVAPWDEEAIAGLEFVYQVPVEVIVTTGSRLEQLLAAAFDGTTSGADDRHGGDVAADADRLRDMASEEPIVRLVNRLIVAASEARASDIHLEPAARETAVRLRIDGILEQTETLSHARAVAAISRVKILANLDIAERRRPQDGRFTFPVAGHAIDIRVSTIPTEYGEGLVLRLLDRSTVPLDLGSIGFLPETEAMVGRLLAKPNGIILVTGPTGSGKTTTLYAFLQRLADGERKILTIEDPIEYRLEGIAQSQVNAAIGHDFASALRALLRHDPDVIMVGEIRDSETAHIAARAALTGHLVLSTLHTNDAPSAIARLVDMGLEDYLVSATLIGILGQRLVRRRCDAMEGEMHAGCAACRGTGYRGRIAILETMEISLAVRAAVHGHCSVEDLRDLALKGGFIEMREDGRRKVSLGLTTNGEIDRALGREGP